MADLVWVDPSLPLSAVAQHLADASERVVVVAKAMAAPQDSPRIRPLGIITETEILRACAQGKDLRILTTEAVMVAALTLAPGESPPPAQALVRQQGHPYLLGVGDQEQLLGVAAITDLEPPHPPGTPPPAQANDNHLITAIISRFADINPTDLDQEIRHALHLIGETTGVQGVYLTLCPQSASVPSRSWWEGLVNDQLIPGPNTLPWSCELLKQERMVCVPNVADITDGSDDVAVDQARWQDQGIGAALSLPLVGRSGVVGAIGVVSQQPVDGWLTETVQLLQVFGKIIVATQQRLEDERQLQESEARLRLALSATNQGLYDIDLTTGNVVVSPEYAKMLGYDIDDYQETEETWSQTLHPEDRDAATALYAAYIAGEIPEYKLRFRLKTRSGKWKWVLSLGKIVAWDETGRPTRMLGTHTDIDDLKQAEEALRASEIRFRTFMDNSPMAAWITNPETNILEYTSQGWKRNYALPPSDAALPQGKSLFDVFPEAIAQVYAHHNRWVVDQGEMLEVVEPGVRADHSPGEFLAFKFPLPQPQGHTLVGGVAIDITERNRTEQRLALQSTILASIARTEPLHDILTALVLALENHLAGSLCSLLFCDGERLYPGAVPNLPPTYSEALRGIAIGEGVGSCGTAVARRQPVIVTDIATDPLWADCRDLALGYDLRACWSVPVIASDGNVLATLAVYYPEPRAPFPQDLDTLQLAANLAKVAIEKNQATQALAQLNQDLEDRVIQRTEALQASEARLKEAQQVARLGWWTMDVASRHLTWSPEAMALLGYSEAEGHLPEMDLRHHVRSDIWDRFWRCIDQALATEESCAVDLPMTRLDGTEGCLFVKATLSAPTPGENSHLFGIAMDVSERWVMQTILQRSEERTRATLLALPDLIFRVSREGIYREFMASPQSGNLVDPEFAVGKHLSEALPPGTSYQHWTQKLKAIQVALDTQTVQCYEQSIPVSGELRYEEVRVAPCGRDEVVFFIRDISDRKRTELELTRSRDLREAVFNESTDALFLVDGHSRRTLDCNQRAVDLFEAEAKHQLINIEGHRLQVHPFTAEDFQAIDEALANHGFWSQELEYRTFQGKVFWGGIASKLITIAGQRLELVRVTDISERKQAEAVLRQTNQELARATRMKDEFLANMSHELRTPLNAILGMTEGLQDEVFGPLNDRQQKALRTIAHSGDHLLELINDILDLAKIEAGQMTLEPTPVSVSYLCSSSLPFVQTQAQAKNIALHLHLPDSIPYLLGDECRLRQVLINLLNNAVKFTPSGGSVTLDVQILTPPAEGEDPWLRITVRDTGIGIAPTDLDKLFQPFVQIDSTLNRQYNGTGLGLALVQRMVELHGGRVQVTSEVGVGSQFAVDLPTKIFPHSPLPTASDQPTDNHKTFPTETLPLILLVDDNEANLHTCASYLGAKGYRLEMAKTGREAVAQAKQHRPDLILMDVQMPDVDGLEATQQIRADPNLAHTLIVALTALAMPQDREYCLAMGLDDYISKPVKLKDLVATIQTLLNRRVSSL
ncbi:MAG: PAS domain S-box protein [Leptolyngbya sp.]|nr:PAS domain S-box protein [Leptolyngbya sp.]